MPQMHILSTIFIYHWLGFMNQQMHQDATAKLLIISFLEPFFVWIKGYDNFYGMISVHEKRVLTPCIFLSTMVFSENNSTAFKFDFSCF
jgi:hypothetical protein